MAKGKKGFEPGISGNPQGRPKGTPNRSTTEIKDLINQFISGNLDDLQTNYDLLLPEKKLQFFKDLLKFVIPSQQANELNINALSDTELDKLTDSLISKINNDEQD